ncbi:hypothetical protein CLAFUW4_20114 [Fulvia fulva]|uniref:uncharacterized protein n=1 Tax=Passalora fulva TaxID=5499 RepID=UPI00285267FE|nr:uncharacterized protein CLAFUR5_20114 [Fulvia fulva]KAK4609306.1 hypothetical protein CLAFUR4_20114 [Fulvia fulva]KAK4609525.1 hypothetical protein CLAFUR0_20114 [Fulvia fulva]WMI39102.1 hypothetical protein CLAFUR5_20114 [Fulvia fulva]WPV22647.1 hypothetical protein CLAFUW4_20114 [Fulvia fulva]WPV37685.1 hypothetical protein CLAFUW7_20114 [Fulvia fulva]
MPPAKHIILLISLLFASSSAHPPPQPNPPPTATHCNEPVQLGTGPGKSPITLQHPALNWRKVK